MQPTPTPTAYNGHAPQPRSRNAQHAGSAPVATFAVAFFDRTSDNAPKQKHLSLDELPALFTTHTTRADKEGPLFSPALYHPRKQRKAENVEAVSCLVFDFDGDADPLEITRQLDEQGLCYTIYTTWSHTRAAPKFRIVIPLAAPVAGEQWQSFYRRAAIHYGQGKADPKCKDASRIFYLPACPPEHENEAWSFLQPGERLLHPDDVPAAPEPPQRPATRPTATAPGDLRPYVRAALMRELAAVRNAPNGHRNDTLNRAAFALGTIIAAGELDAAQVKADLLDAATAADLPEDEARRTLENGLQAGSKKPRQLPEPRQQQRRAQTAAPSLNDSAPQSSTPAMSQAPKSAPAFAVTDTGNAERFAAQHGQRVRYCYPLAQWFIYDGQRWRLDLAGEIERHTKTTARSIYAEAAAEPDDARRAEVVKHARRTEAEVGRAAMQKLARSEPGIPIMPEQLDADAHAFNVANGTLDLQTLTFRPHQREDLLTHLAPVVYDAAAPCSIWRGCLERWLPNEATRDFVQEAVALSLWGVPQDEFWIFLYGDGANGKSTFVRVVEWLCGDYGHKAQAETFMDTARERERGKPAPELLALKGKRLVTVQETAQRHRLNEALLKDLTGRDRITARGIHSKHETTFTPQFTLWMFGNHKPQIKDTSAGTWRRLRLIPFTQTIPEAERDPHLADRLRTELPGVLNWALDGLRRVRERGLVVPDAVRAATNEYRTEQDTFGAFISDRTVSGPRCEATAAQLWKAWEAWCSENGEREGNQTNFASELKRRGFENFHSRSGKKWRGIAVLADQQHELSV